MESVTKAYGGIVAVADGHLDVAEGEVLGLVGGNGAGKSTLLKVLSGLVQPDGGVVMIEGDVHEVLTAASARDSGVAVVQQEISFAPRLSVGEAMGLSVGYPRRAGLVDWKQLHRRAQRRLDDWGLGIDSHQLMQELTPAQHVAVAVLEAIAREARTIILDEPTASFSQPEVDHLLGVVRRLRSEGRSVIYVTHRLDEVFQICDRVTVMRDGHTIGTYAIGELDHDSLVTHIVGHQIPARASGPVPSFTDEEAIRVEDLGDARVGPASFAVRRGEIVGLAGLVGAGRTELLELVAGVRRPTAGRVIVAGRPRRITSPHRAGVHGIGLLPEERRRSGLVLQMSVRENALIPVWQRYAHQLLRWQSRSRQTRDVGGVMKQVALKAPSIDTPVGHLSGGNQQKVVLGRWINAKSDILLLDEPTRGIDIGAKDEIYGLIRSLAASGKSVVVASSEHEELVGLCHRVHIMKEGRITDELVGEQITAEAIARRCFGA
jgi:ABC-type sugar transport system ATPase subunit